MRKRMTYKNYGAEIEYDAQAEIFHGRVLLTRDVVTFEDRSAEELKREMAAAVEDYLTWCAQCGEASEAPRAPRMRAA